MTRITEKMILAGVDAVRQASSATSPTEAEAIACHVYAAMDLAAWQPITDESPPWDGEEVLVCSVDSPNTAADYRMDYGEGGKTDFDWMDDDDVRPEYWRPYPEACEAMTHAFEPARVQSSPRRYYCYHCDEEIPPHEPHWQYKSVDGGGWWEARFHDECHEADQRIDRHPMYEEAAPGSFFRGSTTLRDG